MIFVAILCLDYINQLKTFVGRINLAIGIILLLYGVCLTAIGFAGDNEPLKEYSPKKKWFINIIIRKKYYK